MLLTPIALIGLGSGVAVIGDADPTSFVVGPAIGLVSLILLLPWLHAREVVIDDDAVVVTRGFVPLRRRERHARSLFSTVRWSMTRRKGTVEGGSHAPIYEMHLVGPSVEVTLPLERFDIGEGRELGVALGLPVERVVDGEVVERWSADGATVP